MIDLIVPAVTVTAGVAFGFWLGRSKSRQSVAILERAALDGDQEHPPETHWEPTDRLAELLTRGEIATSEHINRLQASQDTLGRVLRGVPDPVLLVGNGGDIRFANEAAWRVLGDSLDEAGNLLHHRLLEVVRTADSEIRTQIMERFDDRQTYQATTLREVDGAVLVVLRDVTEERRVSEMRRDFVADASHELKTPVAAIQASSETVLAALEDHDLDSSLRFAGQVAESFDSSQSTRLGSPRSVASGNHRLLPGSGGSEQGAW